MQSPLLTLINFPRHASSSGLRPRDNSEEPAAIALESEQAGSQSNLPWCVKCHLTVQFMDVRMVMRFRTGIPRTLRPLCKPTRSRDQGRNQAALTAFAHPPLASSAVFISSSVSQCVRAPRQTSTGSALPGA